MLPERPGTGTQPRVVLDTDTYNEIDDQFALAYLLRAEDKVRAEAIYAAPFHNDLSKSPGDGMEKSYEEIERLLERLGRSEFPHFKGSKSILTTSTSPVASPAASDLAERAMTATHSDRLTVIAIGCITNVASAILMKPEITERITVVWLGGNAANYPHNGEFNFSGDIKAAQAVFDSGVPFYVMPAMGVSSHLTSTREELAAYLNLDDPLCKFLYERFSAYGPADEVWAKEIWDIAGVAWVARPETVKSISIHAPRVADDGSYIHDPRRHLCRFAYRVDRNAIYKDLFARLNPQ